MKKNIVYIIAGLVAVASAVVLFTMFRTQTAETPEPIVVEDIQPVEMTQIIVASKKILSGSQITNDMLKTRQIPKEEKTQSMIVLSTDAEGATANRTIEADQPILTTMLDQPQSYIAGTNGLSYVIPDGMVAVAVNAADLEGVAGDVRLCQRGLPTQFHHSEFRTLCESELVDALHRSGDVDIGHRRAPGKSAIRNGGERLGQMAAGELGGATEGILTYGGDTVGHDVFACLATRIGHEDGHGCIEEDAVLYSVAGVAVCHLEFFK